MKYMGKGLFFFLSRSGVCEYAYNGEGAILARAGYSGSGDFVSFFPCALLQEVKKEGGARMCISLFLVMKEDCTCGLLL